MAGIMSFSSPLRENKVIQLSAVDFKQIILYYLLHSIIDNIFLIQLLFLGYERGA